ncbi:MAG: glutamate synthase large chain, partial [Frankiaceae bacterium]|nr:glutamate synthase large chain [Frankiaceae bacterium]
MVSTPAPQGLYDGRHEHDACGVAFVADMSGRSSHEIVRQGVLALDNLEHRGASGSEVNTGDGAGILIQIPDEFLRAVSGLELPPVGSYAAGMAFLPDDDDLAAAAVDAVETLATTEGLRVIGWRDVPVNADIVGASARAVMPRFRLVFVAAVSLVDGDEPVSGMALERMAFCLRKRAEREAGVYFPSLSARTLVYKGMLTAPQLDQFFPDLDDDRMTSALALVHSRFSTNTFPSWPLAHPYRYIA